MKRKTFLKNSLFAGGAIISGDAAYHTLKSTIGESGERKSEETADPFTMKFSPDFGLFDQAAGNNPIDQIKWAHDRGFRAWENTRLHRRSVEEQKRISRTLAQLGMEFGQFLGTVSFKEVTFAGRDEKIREQVLQDVRESVEIAKRMNTKYIHNVLGLSDPNLQWDFQMANAIELLKRIAEIYEPHGLVMVMETMNHKINHPGMFLHTIPQAYAMARAVDSPSVKILADIYHIQIQEGNLIPTLDYAFDEIAYLQLGDTPGRNEPGTGEINYKNVLQHLYDKGFRGFAGLEHGVSGSGKEGAEAVVDAYRSVDPNSG